MSCLICGDNLVKTYGKGDAAVSALRGVDISIEAGEFIGIMGESGSGKSTLLSILGALNTPTAGKYVVDEIDVYRLSGDQRADFRREFLGYVFQTFFLMPYLTLSENVMLPLATAKLTSKRKKDMAEAALDRVGLSGKGDRLPSQVSGGEQERAALARAIVNEPPILLADEPTGNLDSGTSGRIMHLLRELNRSGMTVVMVTHSEECSRYAERILRLADGRFFPQEGEPGDGKASWKGNGGRPAECALLETDLSSGPVG